MSAGGDFDRALLAEMELAVTQIDSVLRFYDRQREEILLRREQIATVAAQLRMRLGATETVQ